MLFQYIVIPAKSQDLLLSRNSPTAVKLSIAQAAKLCYTVHDNWPLISDTPGYQIHAAQQNPSVDTQQGLGGICLERTV